MQNIHKILPIFIIFSLVVYPSQFIEMSHSILGKLLAIIGIIFYSIHDVLYGIIACFLVAIYYQTLFIQGNDVPLKFSMKGLKESFWTIPDPIQSSHRDVDGGDTSTAANEFRETYCRVADHPAKNAQYSSILHYDNPNQYSIFQYILNPETEHEKNNDTPPPPIFQGKRLEYKGQPVKRENIPYIFPELSFFDEIQKTTPSGDTNLSKGKICDPCSDTCRFSVTK